MSKTKILEAAGNENDACTVASQAYEETAESSGFGGDASPPPEIRSPSVGESSTALTEFKHDPMALIEELNVKISMLENELRNARVDARMTATNSKISRLEFERKSELRRRENLRKEVAFYRRRLWEMSDVIQQVSKTRDEAIQAHGDNREGALADIQREQEDSIASLQRQLEHSNEQYEASRLENDRLTLMAEDAAEENKRLAEILQTDTAPTGGDQDLQRDNRRLRRSLCAYEEAASLSHQYRMRTQELYRKLEESFQKSAEKDSVINSLKAELKRERNHSADIICALKDRSVLVSALEAARANSENPLSTSGDSTESRESCKVQKKRSAFRKSRLFGLFARDSRGSRETSSCHERSNPSSQASSPTYRRLKATVTSATPPPDIPATLSKGLSTKSIPNEIPHGHLGDSSPAKSLSLSTSPTPVLAEPAEHGPLGRTAAPAIPDAVFSYPGTWLPPYNPSHFAMGAPRPQITRKELIAATTHASSLDFAHRMLHPPQRKAAECPSSVRSNTPSGSVRG